MWWCVKMTSPKEVHVYPFDEAREHTLRVDDQLCNCMPEVKNTSGGQMIVHRKIHEPRITPLRKAHWIH